MSMRCPTDWKTGKRWFTYTIRYQENLSHFNPITKQSPMKFHSNIGFYWCHSKWARLKLISWIKQRSMWQSWKVIRENALLSTFPIKMSIFSTVLALIIPFGFGIWSIWCKCTIFDWIWFVPNLSSSTRKSFLLAPMIRRKHSWSKWISTLWNQCWAKIKMLSWFTLIVMGSGVWPSIPITLWRRSYSMKKGNKADNSIKKYSSQSNMVSWDLRPSWRDKSTPYAWRKDFQFWSWIRRSRKTKIFI